jgi:hypothetical protein
VQKNLRFWDFNWFLISLNKVFKFKFIFFFFSTFFLSVICLYVVNVCTGRICTVVTALVVE